MKAESIQIHNFRTFADAEIGLSPYTLLVGANNSGKSNVIEAIRVFYEKDIKFDESRDLPKFPTSDQDSWIEIQYRPLQEEFDALKEEYRQSDGTYRVRKYLKTQELGSDGKVKSGIYAYVDGKPSDSRFYGEKSVQQGKLGDVIYIPAVSKLDEHTKLTGPSALKDLINTVLKKVIGSSPAYESLRTAFVEFSANLKSEETDGESLAKLEAEITKEIEEWGTSFELSVNPITPDELLKNLIGHSITDKRLDAPTDPRVCGQGFQRHLIFTLIRLAAKYGSIPVTTRTDFSPTLTWILFEEPEGFLHPNQIEVLDANLRLLSGEDGSQVLITSHNPSFVSRNIEDLPAMARLHRPDKESKVGQISRTALDDILKANQDCLTDWKVAGISVDDNDMRVEMESVKYALWLNPLRCCSVFANTVLLVEGPTETALLGHMIASGKIRTPSGGGFVMDALGKYNMHRFMNLFGALGISHAVLYDYDGGGTKSDAIAATICNSQNAATIGIDRFENDLEDFLGVSKPREARRKPQCLMWNLSEGGIDNNRLRALAAKVESLLGVAHAP